MNELLQALASLKEAAARSYSSSSSTFSRRGLAGGVAVFGENYES